MDEVVKQVFSYQTVILMIAVVIGTFFVRRVIETAFPKVKQAAPETAAGVTYTNRAAVWWNQVALYFIPVLMGAAMAFLFKDLVALDTFNSKAGLALYGALAGWFSSTGYKVVRKLVQTKTGVDLPAAPTTPDVEVKVETKPEGGSTVEVKVEQKADSAEPKTITTTETKTTVSPAASPETPGEGGEAA